MIDGLFEGLLGGIFGPPLAQILGRYKYWIVFLTGFLAVPIVTTIQGVWTLGWKLFFFRISPLFLSFSFDLLLFVGVNIAVGFGLIVAVFFASLQSKHANKKKP